MPESASQEPNAAEEHKNPKDATSGGEQPRQEQMQQEDCQRTLTGALPPENQQHSSQQASLQSAAIDEQNRPAHDPYWLRSVIISRLQVGDTLERWKSEKVSDEQVKQVLCAFTNSKRKR
jgi:sRNA-binding protein